MTVRRRTLAHLTRALAVSSAVSAGCGSSRVPPNGDTAMPDGGSTSTPPTRSDATSPNAADAAEPGDTGVPVAEETTGAQLPTEPPPVVCDPMPAPYCPPKATGDAMLSQLVAQARWADQTLVLGLTFPRYYAYRIDGVPTATRGTIAQTDPGAGYVYALKPEAANVTMRVTFRVACEGATGTATFDVRAGAPGGDVKVTYVKAGK